jgi:hypothetical protein
MTAYGEKGYCTANLIVAVAKVSMHGRSATAMEEKPIVEVVVEETDVEWCRQRRRRQA